MGEREGRRIRERLAELVHGREFLLRVNAGLGWVGTVVKRFNRDGDEFLLLKNPRPLHGVEEGVSDLIGFEVVEITSEMVGQKIARFVAEEVKATGRLTKKQKSFGEFVTRSGGRFSVLR